MPSNFEKGQAFDAQYERLTDPEMKTRAKRRADQYYGLDLKESKLAIHKSKPHYALMRVLIPIGSTALVLFLVVVAVNYLFPTVNIKVVAGTAVLLLLAVSAITFFARGKLSEEGFTKIAGTLTGNLGSANADEGKPAKNDHDKSE